MPQKASPEAERQQAFPFIPEAMLPAWLVTDEGWIVRHWNSFGMQMVATLCPEAVPHLTDGRMTIGDVEPGHGHLSVWTCLLDLDPPQTRMALEATRVMKEHVEILRRYSTPSLQFDLQALLAELRRVEGTPGVYPYVFDRAGDEGYLRMGIRVQPPEGLRLRAPVSLANPDNSDPGMVVPPMTYIDVVLGYQVKLWSCHGSPVTCVGFCGSQPAFHDATERRRLNLLEKELEELRVTSHLAHALRTPLSNAVANARRINKPGGRDEARRLSGPLLAQIADADALIRLLLFINTPEALPVTASLEAAAVWPAITPAMIRENVAEALMSIFHMRTDRPRDRRAVTSLLRRHGITVPGDADGGEVGDAFARLAEAVVPRGGISFRLTASIQSMRYNSLEIAEQARTVALQLILTELLINAVKHGDANDPRIGFQSACWEDGIEWTVENAVSAVHTADAPRKEGNTMPGSKREVLGAYLNDNAAKILAWKLERLQPRAGWEAYRLRIPLEKKGA